MPDPQKNVAFTVDVSLLDAFTGGFRANPTLAAGDVIVLVDETSLGNITTLPTVSPAAGTNVKVALSATEMNGDRIRVNFVDQTTPAEWAACSLLIDTTLQTIDDVPTASDVATAVWAAGTRTLTSFGTLVADVTADVWAQVIEAGMSALQSLRLLTAAQGGKTSGMDTGTPIVIRDVNDTVDRVTATTDANGNRTAVTLDLT